MARAIEVQIEQVGTSTSEGRARDHRVLIDRPEAKGGEDRGPLGGELLLLSLGGCFMSTLLAAVRAREAQVSSVRITVEGNLADAPDRFSEVTLRVSADHDDPDLMRKLISIAEKGCLVTNTLKQGMPVETVLES